MKGLCLCVSSLCVSSPKSDPNPVEAAQQEGREEPEEVCSGTLGLGGGSFFELPADLLAILFAQPDGKYPATGAVVS